MSDDRRAAIPLTAFPDPAIAYAIADDDARVTAANDAFRRRFDEPSPELRVSTIFDRFGECETTGDRDPVAHVVRGDRIGVRLGGSETRGPFLARVIPSDEDTGFLTFSDLGEYPDKRDAPGVDQVSSVLSHDLRNPLDVAKAHLRAARETGDPEHFDSVAAAHDRMERIVRDVLTLTRDDPVARPSEAVAVEAAARDAWRSIVADRAELTVSESLPTVTADPDRLRRLFENLFRNSVEHGAPDDGDKTAVAVRPFERGFYVADDGPGVPPAKRGLVFDPGYSTRPDGTGLGLAIVERIADAHGWEVTLATADGGGARFEIGL